AILLTHTVPGFERTSTGRAGSNTPQNRTILVHPLTRLRHIFAEASVLEVEEHEHVEREVSKCANRNIPERNVALLESHRARVGTQERRSHVTTVLVSQLNDESTRRVMGQNHADLTIQLLVDDIGRPLNEVGRQCAS